MENKGHYFRKKAHTPSARKTADRSIPSPVDAIQHTPARPTDVSQAGGEGTAQTGTREERVPSRVLARGM